MNSVRRRIYSAGFYDSRNQFKPLVSLFIVFCSLLALVFVTMEERRLGYELHKLGLENRKLEEQIRRREAELARLLRPQRVERLAQEKLTLRKAQAQQVIHLSQRQPEFEFLDEEVLSSSKVQADGTLAKVRAWIGKVL